MTVSALPLYLSAREAAARCGVDERTVRRWIASGRLAADKCGGTFRIAVPALAPFLPGAAAPADVSAADNRTDAAPAMGGSRLADTQGAAGAAATDTEAPHLAAALEHAHLQLVTLARELAESHATAAMWQERCTTLQAQLERPALPAPRENCNGATTISPPWYSWRRWWAGWRRLRDV
jgi:excisionase family DNA binding protein